MWGCTRLLNVRPCCVGVCLESTSAAEARDISEVNAERVDQLIVAGDTRGRVACGPRSVTGAKC